MLVLGSLLALLSGMFNAAAAALEKHEGMRTAVERRGVRLLLALAKRPWWMLAMVLSGAAWAMEAAAFATAPVPVVATLRNAGRGLLVASGGRWLDERFSRLEILGVVLASAGAAITAVGAARTRVVKAPLSNVTEIAVAVVCAAGAATVAGVSAWWARSHAGASGERHHKAAGAATGISVGLLFAGTGVFTKEIGDRFALYGAGGLRSVAASASPWLMIVLAIWSQSLVQSAFRKANAATVSAANASVASIGLIGASFVLYHQALPRGLDGLALLGGVVVAIIGTVFLIGARPGQDRAGEDRSGARPGQRPPGQRAMTPSSPPARR